MEASPTAWFPERPATWTEVGIGILVSSLLVEDFVSGGPLDLPLVALGAVATALAMGPLSTTDLGNRIGARFRAASPLTRATVILLFAATVFLSVWVLPDLADVLSAFGTGMLLSVVAFLVAYLFTVRRIDGWQAP